MSIFVTTIITMTEGGSRNLGGLQVPTSSPPVAPSIAQVDCQLCHPPSRLSSSLSFWDEMPLAHTA
ncbi:hypothetical protein NQZ68_013813 [Dissostichus eleginoides]|nr:hypothetical protein NQZ68_013813 [Dissostichus eleginoides]